jgi:hypothetical protein
MGFGHPVYKTEDPRDAPQTLLERNRRAARRYEVVRNVAQSRRSRDARRVFTRTWTLFGFDLLHDGHSSGTFHADLRRQPHQRLDGTSSNSTPTIASYARAQNTSACAMRPMCRWISVKKSIQRFFLSASALITECRRRFVYPSSSG